MNIPIRLYWNLLAVYLKPQRLKTLLLGILLLASEEMLKLWRGDLGQPQQTPEVAPILD